MIKHGGTWWNVNMHGMPEPTFAHRVKQARLRRGLGAREAAQESGIPYKTWRTIEYGYEQRTGVHGPSGRPPQEKTVLRFARFFGWTIRDAFTWAGYDPAKVESKVDALGEVETTDMPDPLLARFKAAWTELGVRQRAVLVDLVEAFMLPDQSPRDASGELVAELRVRSESDNAPDKNEIAVIRVTPGQAAEQRAAKRQRRTAVPESRGEDQS